MVKESHFTAVIWATWRPFATFLHPLRVEGLENLPKDQPVLLCANHSSACGPHPADMRHAAATSRCGSWPRSS